MQKDIVLNVGQAYRSACTICGKLVTIGGSPDIAGYKFSAHYALPLDKQRPDNNCPGSESLVPEKMLLQLAAA